MNNNFKIKLRHYLEVLLTTLLGSIPLRSVGSNLRSLIYRLVFGKIGRKVYIQEGVEFIELKNIEIGDCASICRGVHIDASGHNNNRISLGSKV